MSFNNRGSWRNRGGGSRRGGFGRQPGNFSPGNFSPGNFQPGNFSPGAFQRPYFQTGNFQPGNHYSGNFRPSFPAPKFPKNFWDTPSKNKKFGKLKGFNSHMGGENKPEKFREYIPREHSGKRLSEQEIGVTEYISDHNGFNGIIKSRYSDFQVSEINEAGEVAKLTDTNPPKRPKEEEIMEDEELVTSKYNLEMLPMETWDKINSLVVSKEPTDEAVEFEVTGMTKTQRTKIHEALKKAFGDAIVSSTEAVGDKKFVKLLKYRKGVRYDNRQKWVWGGEYVHFIVHKENCDTMEAAAKIAERLRMPNIRAVALGYAGTKDRRGKTSQWFSLKRVEPKRIANACTNMRELMVGNFTFSDNAIRLGMLKGNRFQIALRNVTSPVVTVDAACRALQQEGFINYYGLQRFGSRPDTPTYALGRTLLQGNFQEAVKRVLEPYPGPLEPSLTAYHADGPAAAVKLIPRYCRSQMEAKMISWLAGKPNDLFGALNMIPRNTRLLYLHAYQSLIWNKCVSERLKKFGMKPVLGDLVQAEPTQELIDDGEDYRHIDHSANGYTNKDSSQKDSMADDSTADNSMVEDLPVDDDKNGTDNEDDESKLDESKLDESKLDETNGDENKASEEKVVTLKLARPPLVKVAVKALTEEDIESGQYSIKDLVMPLPGGYVEYPPNMKDYYEELLKKDGLALDMRHQYRAYCMTGAYRRVVVVPNNLSWRIVPYADPRTDLILSDRDEITNKTLKMEDEGQYRALLLTMDLPASCYATMALRELLRVDTSSFNQAAQNDYHRPPQPTIAESEQIADSEQVAESEQIADSEQVVDLELIADSEQPETKEGGTKRKLEEDTSEVDLKKQKEGE